MHMYTLISNYSFKFINLVKEILMSKVKNLPTFRILLKKNYKNELYLVKVMFLIEDS